MSTVPCPQCIYLPDMDPGRIPLQAPRLQALLNTNECLAEGEESNFLSFVANGSEKLAYINARITAVKALLRELKVSKEELQMAITEHKKILSPMRRMPDELLREIFLHGAGHYSEPTEYLKSAPHSLDLSSAPWIYGQVCRRWRGICLHTSSLWTRVKIEVDKIILNPRRPVTAENLIFALRLLSLYLGRSNMLPLHVYLDLSSNYARPLNTRVYGISALMFTHSRRWESLILARGQDLTGTAILMEEDSFASLTTLQIEENSAMMSSISITAPCLRSWSTIGCHSSIMGIPLSSPLCHQITDYSISAIAPFEVTRVVQLLPHLRKLTVGDLYDDHHRNPGYLESLRLPGLKELVIEKTNQVTAEIFLESISCPSLTSLSVHVCILESLASVIQEFETRSNFYLQHWESIATYTGSVMGIIQNTANIQRLVVRGIGDWVSLSPPAASVHDIVSGLYGRRRGSEQRPDRDSGGPQIVPFPSLSQFELHLGSLPECDGRDTMEELYLFAISRALSMSHYATRKVDLLVTAPDDQAKKMLRHRRLIELRSLDINVEIIAL